MTGLPPELLTVLASWGLPGLIIGVLYKLWRDSEEKREVERKDASEQLRISYEKRLDESRQNFQTMTEMKSALVENKNAVDALTKSLEFRRTA